MGCIESLDGDRNRFGCLQGTLKSWQSKVIEITLVTIDHYYLVNDKKKLVANWIVTTGGDKKNSITMVDNEFKWKQ